MSGGPWRRRRRAVALVTALVAVTGVGCMPAVPAGGGRPPAVTVTRLTLPDGTRLNPNDINDAGEVAALEHDPLAGGELEWYLWRDGEVTPIGPAPPLTLVSDLSERGQVVGGHGPLFEDRDAFSWHRGTWTPLEDGGGYASADVVNDRGQIAGSITSSWRSRVVVWDERGRVTATLHRDGADVVDINNRGQVLLEIDYQGFVWQVGGGLTPLGTLGGERSDGTDINDAGEVTGGAYTATGELHAFVWRDGRMTDLGGLGGGNSRGTAINEAGEVAGWAVAPDQGTHATLWDADGRLTDLGTLGGDRSSANALNERGQVVGESTTAAGEVHAFLWQDGRMIDLNVLVFPESESGSAQAINERGQIIGGVAVDQQVEEPVIASVVWTAPR